MGGGGLEDLLARFSGLAMGVIGDFCLDAYWLLDETDTESSAETGRPTRAVRGQVYSLGGAGNVARNLKALGVLRVLAFGVAGTDPFGSRLLELLDEASIDATGLIVQKDRWDTCAYVKPYLGSEERERLDLGKFNTLSEASAERLLQNLERALPRLDGLIINQQIRSGLHSDTLIPRLQRLADRATDKIVLLDARHHSDRYSRVIFKLNAAEAARLCGQVPGQGRVPTAAELATYARRIRSRSGRDVVITRGEQGILAFDGKSLHEAPGIRHTGATDPVGAGDTAAAAITATLAAKGTLAQAIRTGNCAAAVVVRKLRQTGTATPAEILAMAAAADALCTRNMR